MGVYIKGMEMPTSPVLFCIHPDGKVFADLEGGWREYKAVPVPPHGRLIDADALREDWLENGENEYIYDTNAILCSLDAAPAIIPAEEAPAEDTNVPTGPYDLLYEEGGANTT